MTRKQFRQIFTAALVSVPTFSTVGTALAAGSFSYPAGQVVYTYTSPSVSIYGAIQVGGSPSASVSQNSAHNIAVVGQTGNTPSASVTQVGSLNAARVTQIGRSTSALTMQFGNIESLIGQ